MDEEWHAMYRSDVTVSGDVTCSNNVQDSDDDAHSEMQVEEAMVHSMEYLLDRSHC